MASVLRHSILGLLFVAASGLARPVAAATFEASECPKTHDPVPALKTARCGWLIVPENRSKPGSRSIRLPVVIVPAVDKKANDPIVYMEGGPGGPVVPSAQVMVEAKINQGRDVILLGQRGSLYAKPSLICPEVDATNGPLVNMMRNGPEAQKLYVDANRTCRERLVKDGVDLNGYNTTESATDFAELRQALNIPEWNVLGVSYGTDLALTYMREHPAGVRSVTIDSVLPPPMATVAVSWTMQREGLDEIFKACAADPACHARYPDPFGTLVSLVKKYEATPLKVRLTPVLVPGDKPDPADKPVDVLVDGASITYWAGAASELFGNRLPEFLDQMASGKTDGVAASIAAIGFAHSTEPLSFGLLNGVTCSEWAPYESADSVMEAGKKAFPDYPASVLSQSPQFPFLKDICKMWDVAKAPAAQREVTRNAIPTLVIAGSYDAMTSAKAAEAAAKPIPGSTLIVIPGVGHYVLPKSECAQKVMHAFVDNPKTKPDTSCVAALKVPPFKIAPK
jgi:pimeloyl-ACP methyl ester carboxylesterase